MDMFPKFILLLLSIAAGLSNCESQEFNEKVKYLDAGNGTQTDDGVRDSKKDFPGNDAEGHEKDMSGNGTLNISCTCTLSTNILLLTVHDGNKILENGDEVKSGTEIKFMCNKRGYAPNGPTAAMCQPDCSWNPPDFPSCILRHVKQCETPNNPLNGVALFRNRTRGSKLTYKCNEGYQLSPPEKRMCGADGKWTGTEPACEAVTCDIPRDPDNGKVFYTSLEYNSELTYVCDNGGQLTSSQKRRCGPDGNWTGVEPYCEVSHLEKTEKRECGEPRNYDKAKVKDPSDEPYKLGSTITYLCDHGYITGGGARKQSTCTEDPETRKPVWTNVEIVCSPKSCGDPGFVMNAQKVGSRFTFPNNVTYKCDAGYKISGNPRRFCLASGVWSGTLPTCNKITCQRPRNPTNGVALYNSLEYDSVLTYECVKGFQLSSNVRRICGSDEKWTGGEPFCEEVECEMPDKPEYGSVELVGDKARVSSIAIFKCDTGRNLIGSGTSRCLQTGEWSFPAPECVEPCTIPAIPNGQLGIYEDVYKRWSRIWEREFKQVYANIAINEGSQLTLKCNRNYMPNAHPRRQELQITCLSGKLSPPPECVTTSCLEDPPTTENARVRRPSYNQHGSKLSYNCNENFKRTKSGNVKCEYGSWVGDPPVCEDTRCHKESLNYIGLTEVQFSFIYNGNNFTPKCQAGYRVSRNTNADIYCREGKWTGNIPPCIKVRCSTEDLVQYTGIRLQYHRNLNHDEWIQPECDVGFEIKNKVDPNIYCNQGEWEGNLPPCFSTHCNTTGLSKYRGINFEVHSILENGSSIEPKCAEGFELQNKDDPRIYCYQGEWTGNLPPCRSKSCDDPPPPTPNGEPHISSRKHGHVVWYRCNTNFERIKEGNVTCVSGNWEGIPPVCGDTRCHKESLNRPDLINVPHDPLLNGESFTPICKLGFRRNNDQKIYCTAGKWTGNIYPCTADGCRMEDLSEFKGLVLNDNRTSLKDEEWIQPTCSEGFELNKNKNNDSLIYCRVGDWTGNLPPCSPAMCLNDPPVPPNGRIISIYRGHGGSAEYECSEFYVKSAQDKVVCSYGKWTGTPICTDTRCYFKDLPQYEGLDLTLNLTIHSKGNVDISCIKGYRSKFSKFYCECGEWRKTSKEPIPCEEDDCEVVHIKDGVAFKETTEYRIDFFFIKLGKRTSLKMATIGSFESSGAVLYVKCNGEENDKYIPITCRRGEWTPSSVCGNRSNSFGTRAPEVQEGTIKTSSTDGITKYPADNFQTFTEATGNGDLKISPPNLLLVKSTDTISVCSCRYATQDSILIGYDGNKKLGFNDVVKSGSTVTFHCNDPGLFILRGERNVRCPPGCQWHSSSYPSCHVRTGYDVVIRVRADPAENLDVLAGGIYTVKTGTHLYVQCQTSGGYITELQLKGPKIDIFPTEVGCADEWNDCYYRAGENNCEYHSKMMEQHCRRTCGFCNSEHPYIRSYHFHQASSTINGEYTCTDFRSLSDNNFQHSVTIEVKDIQCTPIVETKNLLVSYEASRNVNTKAYFSCVKPYTKYGPYNVTCEQSGEWSEPAATCKYIQCPEIASGKPLNVTFSDNRNVNSVASFQCPYPYKRYGSSQATCKASGLWSEPTPSCHMPTCSLAAVYDSLPESVENLVPNMTGIQEGNVQYGFSMNLRCDQTGLALEGNSTIVCNEDGRWTVDKNVKCVKGCAGVQKKKDSRLQISSDKETYEIGDSLTFLCPEGMTLTPDVQRIMCISAGWTPNIIPDCQ